MKKIFSIVVCLLLISTSIIPIYAIDNLNINYSITAVVNNLSDKINDSSIIYNKKHQIKINNIKISNDNLTIHGYVPNNDSKDYFELSGKILCSKNTNTLYIGKLIDKNKKFEVVNFSIDLEPSKPKIGITDKNKKFKNNDVLVKLYLKNIDNEKFYLHEETNNKLRKIITNNNSIKKAKDNIEAWYVKYITPKVTEINITKENFDSLNIPGFKSYEELNNFNVLNKDEQNMSMIMSTSKITNKKIDTVYQFQYDVIGGTVTEKMIVRHLVDYPTNITNDGWFNTKLFIVSESTIESWSNNVIYDTNMRIGAYRKTNVDSYTDPGDYFRTISWSGKYYKGASVKFYIGWSLILPGTPLYFTSNYESSSTKTIGSSMNFDNSGNKKVRQAGTEFKKGIQLRDIGHYFDVNYLVGHYDSPGNKKMHVRWTYDVSNTMDYTYGGTKTKEITVNYCSN
ncbi:hypothetical protein [Caminicella sporogenes]|uniref:hypothetical protein n=1 Tax=Caminicella sporogenes TaxID=166485 RepID=UPI0025418AD9|nr:hypothetical protein [Caminicella sporogenes]WIF94209.1 hypothetical protein QNI18_07805 [Caminicella sporogenes]